MPEDGQAVVAESRAIFRPPLQTSGTVDDFFVLFAVTLVEICGNAEKRHIHQGHLPSCSGQLLLTHSEN